MQKHGILAWAFLAGVASTTASAQSPVPISGGGTGVTTAPAALANLGGQAQGLRNLGLGDLRRYGWHGDGTTDDTAAFVAALNALPPAGGEIIVPFSAPGTVLGSSTIVVDKPVMIRGEGGGPYGQVTIRPQNRTATIFDVTAQFVTFSDLAIDTVDHATTKQTAGSYIVVEPGAARFRADRLTLSEFHEGITVPGDTKSIDIMQLRGFLYSRGNPSSTALLHLQGGYDVRVSDITVNGPGTGTADVRAGIWIESLGDAVISNANVIGMGTGLLVEPGAGQTVASLWVVDSFFDSAVQGVSFAPKSSGSTTGVIVRSRLSNVWAGSNRLGGIRVQAGVDGLDIDNPHVVLNGLINDTGTKPDPDRNTYDGISLQGGTNVRIRGGQIADNGADGVHVAPGVMHWSVANATIGNTAGLPGNGRFAVEIDTGSSDYFQVQDNDVSGNGAVTVANGAVVDNSSGTHKSIVGNIGDTVGYAAYRDRPTGFLTFRGNQAKYNGYRFVGPDGTAYATASAAGLTLGVPLAIAQGGTGATAAQASRANLGVTHYANVQDYGAVNDCKTDSAAAINRALATGLPVYLPGSPDPAACYAASGTLTANGPSVTVFGDGDTSRVTYMGPPGYLFTVGTQGGSTVSMHDMILASTVPNAVAVYATGAVSRASFRNIQLVATEGGKFENGFVFTFSSTQSGDIDIGASIDVTATGIWASNLNALHIGAGSKIINCGAGILLRGNVLKVSIDGGTSISSCQSGIVADTKDTPKPNGTLSADASVSIAHASSVGVNVLESGLTQLNWSGSITNAVHGINIHPNQPPKAAFSIIGARLSNCSQYAIAVSSGVLNVSGSQFYNNGTSGSTAPAAGAIYLESAVGATVVGNRFSGTGAVGGKAYDFVSLAKSGNYVITNNVLSGQIQNNGSNGLVQANILAP